jgi:nitrate reductase NapAB chaperone NapD
MAVVGAFARIDLSDPQAVRDRLSDVRGVTLFDLDDSGKVGLVIEARDLDAAHATLRREIENTDGVLGAWPVYAHAEPDPSDSKC